MRVASHLQTLTKIVFFLMPAEVNVLDANRLIHFPGIPWNTFMAAEGISSGVQIPNEIHFLSSCPNWMEVT